MPECMPLYCEGPLTLFMFLTNSLLVWCLVTVHTFLWEGRWNVPSASGAAHTLTLTPSGLFAHLTLWATHIEIVFMCLCCLSSLQVEPCQCGETLGLLLQVPSLHHHAQILHNRERGGGV